MITSKKWLQGHHMTIQSCGFFFFCPFQFKILRHLITKALKRIYTLFILISLPLQKYIYPCADISSYEQYMALSHYVSSYENVQNVKVFKTTLQVTIFKARQKNHYEVL